HERRALRQCFVLAEDPTGERHPAQRLGLGLRLVRRRRLRLVRRAVALGDVALRVVASLSLDRLGVVAALVAARLRVVAALVAVAPGTVTALVVAVLAVGSATVA